MCCALWLHTRGRQEISHHTTENFKVLDGFCMLTMEYLRGKRAPGSNEVIHVTLRKRKLARFQLFSSFMFLCDL